MEAAPPGRPTDAEPEDEPRDDPVAEARWWRVVDGAKRLAHVRRIWGLLGGHLLHIKRRGQGVAVRGAQQIN